MATTFWRDILPPETVTLGDLLADKAAAERAAGKTIYPAQADIFKALQLTPPDSVKIVIIGQDPYHGKNQATGLAFSVANTQAPPPSLYNIISELAMDCGVDRSIMTNRDLTPWAQQGVLLLNTSLTVQAGMANSHASWGWQDFTKAVFDTCMKLPQPIVFVLWGAQARKFVSDLKFTDSKPVICSSHPSPLGAFKNTATAPAFMGSRPFTHANKLLNDRSVTPIDWLSGLTTEKGGVINA